METGYERFGIISNPFHGLDSESIHDLELYHVNQDVDSTLRTIKQEVLDGQRKGAVALVGALGAGKTERLLMAQRETSTLKVAVCFQQLSTDTQWIVRALAANLRRTMKPKGLAASFTSPKWYKRLAKLPRKTRRSYDPEEVGVALAEALNANTPAFLLLNDLHNISDLSEADRFLLTLQSLITHADSGVLVMLTVTPEYYEQLEERHGALTARLNRVFRLQRMTENEAGLLLAKRLAGKRIVEDLDATYPFARDAVSEMNRIVESNPRRLLKLADQVLERAVAARAYHIDGELVRSVAGVPEAVGTVAGALVEKGPTGAVHQYAREGNRPNGNGHAPGASATKPTPARARSKAASAQPSIESPVARLRRRR